MTGTNLDLVMRLETVAGMFKGDDLGATVREGAKEIVRLRKIVDALTVKLNKVLNEQYVSEALLKERIDACEHKMARLGARVEQLRYAKEPQQ